MLDSHSRSIRQSLFVPTPSLLQRRRKWIVRALLLELAGASDDGHVQRVASVGVGRERDEHLFMERSDMLSIDGYRWRDCQRDIDPTCFSRIALLNSMEYRQPFSTAVFVSLRE